MKSIWNSNFGFHKWSFTGRQPHSFMYIWSMAAFTWQQLSCTVMGTIRLAKPEIFTVWLFTEKSLPIPGREPERRKRALLANQKSKFQGYIFHCTSITLSRVNLTAAPWNRWDRKLRKLRNREVTQRRSHCWLRTNQLSSLHLTLTLCPRCRTVSWLSDQFLYPCPKYYFSPS